MQHAIKVAKIVKEIDPDVLTVVGGPHVSAVPEEFLNEAESVDIGVTGEGEYAMLDIVKMHYGQRKSTRFKGLFIKDGTVVQTPPRPLIENLDELPYPAYHLVDMERYLNPERIENRSFKDRTISK